MTVISEMVDLGLSHDNILPADPQPLEVTNAIADVNPNASHLKNGFNDATPAARNDGCGGVPPEEKNDTVSPASGVEVNQSKIRVWIHEQDLESLEKVLWEGEGFALLKHTSGHPKIRKFLEAAPRLMVRFAKLWTDLLSDFPDFQLTALKKFFTLSHVRCHCHMSQN